MYVYIDLSTTIQTPSEKCTRNMAHREIRSQSLTTGSLTIADSALLEVEMTKLFHELALIHIHGYNPFTSEKETT